MRHIGSTAEPRAGGVARLAGPARIRRPRGGTFVTRGDRPTRRPDEELEELS